MNQKPKGGDIVLDPRTGCLFVSIHTRSKIYRPIPHKGSDDKFIRVENNDTEQLVVLNEENTNFVDVKTAFKAIKSQLAKYKGKILQLEAVVVPDVSMDKNAAVVLLDVSELPVKVIAASKDESLKNLFEKTADTINQIVASTKNESLKKQVAETHETVNLIDNAHNTLKAPDDKPDTPPAPAVTMRM